MILDRKTISDYLPHGDAAILIDSIEVFEGTSIVCASSRHHDLDNPFRVSTDEGSFLPASAILEFAAQTAALHATMKLAQLSDASPRQATIAKISKTRWGTRNLDTVEGKLHIGATCVSRLDGAALYDFSVGEENGAELGAGRLTLVMI